MTQRKLSELYRYQIKIKILWAIHSLVPSSWLSGKIHGVYNLLKRYGHFEGQDLILKEAVA